MLDPNDPLPNDGIVVDAKVLVLAGVDIRLVPDETADPIVDPNEPFDNGELAVGAKELV